MDDEHPAPHPAADAGQARDHGRRRGRLRLPPRGQGRRLGHRRRSSACASSPDLLSLLAAGPPGRPCHRHQRQDHDHEADHRRARTARRPDRLEHLRREHGGRADVRAQPRARRAGSRSSRPTRSTSRRWSRRPGPGWSSLLNLSRDQMDRAAEIWLLARRWREALAAAPDCRVVANADDPLVAWAAGSARQVTWVAAGQRVARGLLVLPQLRRPPAARRRRLVLQGMRPAVGPPVSWMLYGDEVIDPSGRATPLESRAARPGEPVQRGDRARGGGGVRRAARAGAARAAPVTSVAGRYTQVNRRGCDIRLLLAKNPAGWLEALDVMAPPPAPCCSRSTPRDPTAGTRRGCGTWTSAGCAAGTSWSAASAGSTWPSGWRPTRWQFRLVNDIDEAVDAVRSGSREPRGARELHRVPAVPHRPREGAVMPGGLRKGAE